MGEEADAYQNRIFHPHPQRATATPPAREDAERHVWRPPIVCHHDFSQCALEEALFPTNVRFVHPHIVTRWGHITLPLAALKAFSLLRKYDQPDWVFLLSGSDYPIRPADEIVADLANANFDVYLDNREIRYHPLDLGQRLGFGQSPDGDLALTIIGAAQDGGFERPSWIPLAYYRYCTCRRPTKTLLFSGRLLSYGRRQFIPIRNHPIDCMTRWPQFNRPSRMYGGCF
jgi:hypothetical protein